MKKPYVLSELHLLLNLMETHKLKVGDCFQIKNSENPLNKKFEDKIFKIVSVKCERDENKLCDGCAFLNRESCYDIPCPDIRFKEIDYYEILFSNKEGEVQ